MASDLLISTSLLLYCSYYDHCGVCQGNGQSCCKCQPPNHCYTSHCNITSGACINTAIKCPKIDACHTSYCQPTNGKCLSKQINCNDFNNCTLDSCDADIGCQHKIINCDGKNFSEKFLRKNRLRPMYN